MSKIALLGCGVQGGAIAQRLLQAGVALTVYDPVLDRALATGASVADGAAEAVRGADWVLVVVDAGPAVRDLLTQPEVLANLKPGVTVIQMGTQSPQDAQDCAQAVERAGGELVCAVLHGVRAAILEGQVLMLYGGPVQRLESVQSCLAPVGRCLPVGTPEQAAAFNAAGLVFLYSILHGFALGGALAERSGIAWEDWYEHVLGCASLLPAMSGFFGPAHFRTRDYRLQGPCQFRGAGAVEETRVMLELARHLGVDTSLIASFFESHSKAAGELDFSAVYEVLAPATGP